jgi:hypothetical protein
MIADKNGSAPKTTPRRGAGQIIAAIEAYKKLHSTIEELFHSNIQAAIDYALSLPEDDPNIVQLKASTLVDGGYQIKSEAIISEGINLFEKLVLNDKFKIASHYNLANGHHDLAILKWVNYGNEWKTQYKWYMGTIRDRLLAKHNYSVSISEQTNPKLLARALNNRANMLNSAFRWIEATREYTSALKNDPKHGVAAGGIIKQIMNGYYRTAIHKSWLPVLIPPLYKTVIENEDYSIELCGKSEYQRMFQQFADWKIQNIPHKPIESNYKNLTQYQSFILSNDLYLSPVMSREFFAPDLCDSLQITKFISKETTDKFEIPSIFGMFNVIKADYLTIRWLAFNYFYSDLPKNSYYHDTLNYAVYGTKPSLLSITQRLAFDILDKIAVATLSLIGDKDFAKAYFRDAWFQKTGKGKVCPDKLKSTIESEIIKGNKALIALSELAFDIYDYYQDGCSYLKRKHKLRNSSTHRFTVMHDLGSIKEFQDHGIDHYDLNEVEKELVDTLFIVKAAIIYFVEAVYFQNGILQENPSGKFCELSVPLHKSIRGEKS